MDKVLTAFVIATGFAAMGVEVKIWFTMWGGELPEKTPRAIAPLAEASPVPGGGKEYRRVESDTMLQNMVEMLNRGGPGYLPMSRLNLFGLGPIIFNVILKLKNIPTVEEFIFTAQDMVDSSNAFYNVII